MWSKTMLQRHLTYLLHEWDIQQLSEDEDARLCCDFLYQINQGPAPGALGQQQIRLQLRSVIHTLFNLLYAPRHGLDIVTTEIADCVWHADGTQAFQIVDEDLKVSTGSLGCNPMPSK